MQVFARGHTADSTSAEISSPPLRGRGASLAVHDVPDWVRSNPSCFLEVVKYDPPMTQVESGWHARELKRTQGDFLLAFAGRGAVIAFQDVPDPITSEGPTSSDAMQATAELQVTSWS